MFKKTKLVTAILVSTLALSGAAVAVDFDELDIDVDGKLSQDELKEYNELVQYWSEIDTDGDRFINIDEFTAMVDDPTLAEKTGWTKRQRYPDSVRVQPAEMADVYEEFAALDVNGDDVISKAEMQNHAGVVMYWIEVDRNRDDNLDREEFEFLNNDPDLSDKTGWKGRTTSPPGVDDKTSITQ